MKTKFNFVQYSGEPCGCGEFPDTVLASVPWVALPMVAAISLDKKKLWVTDSVDHHQTACLDKEDVADLINQLRQIHDFMEEDN